jgi:uncharacterized membrane protein YccC
MLALFIALSFNLPNPWWAVVTVFLTSQATSEGAIWAKGIYRIGGTLVGLLAALAIIPNLVDAPELMFLALALWLAACVYVSLLDRTPGSYLPLLAGYGAILVGLPLIDNPANIFDTAIYRTQEILIGVVCATVIHSAFYPRTVLNTLQMKVAASMSNARKALLDTLLEREPSVATAGAQLGGAIVDISIQATVLKFEAPRGRGRGSVPQFLAEHLALLAPLITTLRQNKVALGSSMPPFLQQTSLAVANWIEAGALDPDSYSRVQSLLAENTLSIDSDSSKEEILQVCFIELLKQLIVRWRDCCQLADAIYHPGFRLTSETQALVRKKSVVRLHVDRGIALWSALNAAIAVLVCAGLGMWIQWPPATVGIGIAAVLTSLFAGFDDPTPIMRRMLTWTVISIPVGAVYVFGILPAIDGFLQLTLVLFPIIAIPAALMMVPTQTLRALAFLLGSTTVIGLQPLFKSDFESFWNLALSSTLGTVLALITTRLFRVIEKNYVARRITRAGWKDLARFCNTPAERFESFAVRMLDRVGLLLPRLQTNAQLGAGTLRELRIGMALAQIRSVPALNVEQHAILIASLSQELHNYFRDVANSKRDLRPPPQLTELIIKLRADILEVESETDRRRAITAWTGLESTVLGEANV